MVLLLIHRTEGQFDPASIKIPEQPYPLLHQAYVDALRVLDRAGIDLKDTDLANSILEDIWNRIEWFFESEAELEFGEENARDEGGAINFGAIHPDNTSHAEALSEYLYSGDVIELSNGKTYTAAAGFSILALAHIDNATYWLNEEKQFKSTPKENSGGKVFVEKDVLELRTYAGDEALRAFDALRHADAIEAALDAEADVREGKAMAAATTLPNEEQLAARASVLAAEIRTESARKAADARHAENRAMKLQIHDWCSTHLGGFPSIDQAAQAASRIVPVSFRTAHKWIVAYKRSLVRAQ